MLFAGQDAVYDADCYINEVQKKHPDKLWEVLMDGRSSQLGPELQAASTASAEEKSLTAFKDDLHKVCSGTSPTCSRARLQAHIAA